MAWSVDGPRGGMGVCMVSGTNCGVAMVMEFQQAWLVARLWAGIASLSGSHDSSSAMQRQHINTSLCSSSHDSSSAMQRHDTSMLHLAHLVSYKAPRPRIQPKDLHGHYSWERCSAVWKLESSWEQNTPCNCHWKLAITIPLLDGIPAFLSPSTSFSSSVKELLRGVFQPQQMQHLFSTAFKGNN